jgi:hypothetical protein
VQDRLISGIGPPFKSKIYKELNETYDIKALYSANYHAQNNFVERVNVVIEGTIRVYLGNDQREWDLHLPKIIWAKHTSVHSITKYTPYYLNFGKQIKFKGSKHKLSAPPNEDVAIA